jgi:hypothetical protein
MRAVRARRLRGWLLRLVLNRRSAMIAGALLAAPGALLLAIDYAWESWMTDGLALLTLATGVALLWAGLTGRRSDWTE